jgi:membrane fusion protein (multidrug efflux system)
MNKNNRFGIIAIALAGLAGLGYYAYTANRAPAAVPVTPAGAPGKPAAGGGPASIPTAVEVARVAASDLPSARSHSKLNPSASAKGSSFASSSPLHPG